MSDALTEGELTYVTLKDKLNKHLASMRNVKYEIFMFHQAAQESGKNKYKYHARSRHLAKSCECHDRELKKSLTVQCCTSNAKRTVHTHLK